MATGLGGIAQARGTYAHPALPSAPAAATPSVAATDPHTPVASDDAPPSALASTPAPASASTAHPRGNATLEIGLAIGMLALGGASIFGAAYGPALLRHRGVQAAGVGALVAGGLLLGHANWIGEGTNPAKPTSGSPSEPSAADAPTTSSDAPASHPPSPTRSTGPAAPGNPTAPAEPTEPAAPTSHAISGHYVQLVQHGTADPAPGSAPGAFTRADRATGPGWLAADMGWSVQLPGGREAFFYGDTVTGSADTRGDRVTTGGPFLRNSIVVHDGDTRTTLATRAADGSLHAPLGAAAEPDTWTWPGSPVVDSGRVRLVTATMRKTETGTPGWNFATTGFRLVTLGADDLAPQGDVAFGTRTDISWGAGMVVDGDHEVVAGTKQHGFGQQVFLARVGRPGTPGASTLEVWNGRAWTTDEAAAAPVTDSIGAQLLRTKAGWAMLGQPGVFGAGVSVRTAPALTGPWSASRTVGSSGALATGEIRYTPTAHPELSRGGQVVVSTSANTSDGQLHPELDRYRPRWSSIPTSALEPQPAPHAKHASGD